ncbi:MAG TPA: hypothetical protein VG815_07965 [Chloroflexota bacterium]|nr:hypothetical protein [Chloroflexota bacterium]
MRDPHTTSWHVASTQNVRVTSQPGVPSEMLRALADWLEMVEKAGQTPFVHTVRFTYPDELEDLNKPAILDAIVEVEAG